MTGPHLDDEELSAALDGQLDGQGERSPQAAHHLSRCASCSGRMQTLARVTAAVRRPPPSPPEHVRERAVRAALDAGRAGRSPARQDLTGQDLTRHDWRSRTRRVGQAAAAIAALLLLAVPVIGGLRGGGSESDEASSGAAPATSAPAATNDLEGGSASGTGDAGGTTAARATGAPGVDADLGALGDTGTLVLRVQEALAGAGQTPPTPNGSPTPPDGSQPGRSPASCTDAARQQKPSDGSPADGSLAFVGSALWMGTPAVVFAELPVDHRPTRVQVHALDDCRLLVQTGG